MPIALSFEPQHDFRTVVIIPEMERHPVRIGGHVIFQDTGFSSIGIKTLPEKAAGKIPIWKERIAHRT